MSVYRSPRPHVSNGYVLWSWFRRYPGRKKKKKTLRLRFRGTGQNIFSCSVKRVLTHLKVWPRQRGFRGRRKFEDYINLAISGPVAVLNNGILFFTILKSDQPWHREFVAKDDKHVKSRCHCFQVARYKGGKKRQNDGFLFPQKNDTFSAVSPRK